MVTIGERCNSHQLSQEVQCLQVFEDIARFVGQEQHVEALQRLVDVAHRIRLDEGVLDGASALLSRTHELRKGSEQTLYADSADVHELARHQSCKRANRSTSCSKIKLKRKGRS